MTLFFTKGKIMTIINSTKFLDFKSAKSPSGTDWFYVKRTNDKDNLDSAVVITTLVKKENEYYFLFLKTQRPPILAENKAKYCLESPAGLIADENKDETLEICANKELLEEAGYKPDKIFLELTNSSTSAGLSSETLSYMTAIIDEDIKVLEPVNDGGIIIDRIFVKTDDIYSFLNELDKKLWSISSVTLCGVFYALKRLKSLTQR